MLAHTADRAGFRGVSRTFHHRTPVAKVGRGCLQLKAPGDDVVETGNVQFQRDLVDAVGIESVDHGFAIDITKEADLLNRVGPDLAVGADDDHVRVDATASQFGHRMLRRFGLQFL
ncbi:hypothetical protein BMS3Bbin01_01332 [bacterium BMS3Bbin01]|nr:hypothetical protein BMS3Bbin01_01332 [bacterium BMS3Bbin01]